MRSTSTFSLATQFPIHSEKSLYGTVFSRDGSYGSWKVGTGYWGSPYTTNVSWQAPVGPDTQAGIDTPGWTKFYRRERPELHLDRSGAPSYLLNGVQYGLEYPEHQYSFTLIQHVNTAPE